MQTSNKPRVFLGGTGNNSKWRDKLIPLLTIDYFSPIVHEWTNEAKARELQERKQCDVVVYAITPEMAGVYSIAEAVDDSNKRPERMVLCILEWYVGMRAVRFTKPQLKSLDAVAELVLKNGGRVCRSLDELAATLNQTIKLPASATW